MTERSGLLGGSPALRSQEAGIKFWDSPSVNIYGLTLISIDNRENQNCFQNWVPKEEMILHRIAIQTLDCYMSHPFSAGLSAVVTTIKLVLSLRQISMVGWVRRRDIKCHLLGSKPVHVKYHDKEKASITLA